MSGDPGLGTGLWSKVWLQVGFWMLEMDLGPRWGLGSRVGSGSQVGVLDWGLSLTRCLDSVWESRPKVVD